MSNKNLNDTIFDIRKYKGEMSMECKLKKLDTIINLIDTENYNKITGVLTIPDGVEEINGEFYYKRRDVEKLKKVKGLKIPNSVIKIGKYAFRRTGISNVKFPENIQEIELGAFELCTDLIEISVRGKKVPLIENDSFIGCESLEKFYNEDGDIDVKTDFRISNKAFSTCYKLLNEQNKWLMVVTEKENKFKKCINKIIKAISSLLKANGLESIKNKF